MNRSADLRPGSVYATNHRRAGPEAGAPPRFMVATHVRSLWVFPFHEQMETGARPVPRPTSYVT
jgi:hypothetical protein